MGEGDTVWEGIHGIGEHSDCRGGRGAPYTMYTLGLPYGIFGLVEGPPIPPKL